MDLGQCLKLAAEAFSRQFAVFLTASLMALVGYGAIVGGALWLVAPLAPLVFAAAMGLLVGGLAKLGLAVIGEQGINATDVFEPLKRPVDFIVVGLALQVGALLFGIGVLLTQTLFVFAPIFVAEGDDFRTALGRSKDLVLSNLAEVVLFALAMLAINVVAAGFSCGFALCVSLPLTTLATIRLYHQLTGVIPSDVSIPPPPRSSHPPARSSARPSRRPSGRP